MREKTFVFTRYQLHLFQDSINLLAGYQCWGVLHYDLYEQDSKLQCNLKKVSKLTFKVAHPGNNKQDASLALEIFDQATSVSIKSH